MKKILIKDLEEKIGYKIKKNFKSIGLDCAQKTGIAILESDSKYLRIESMVLSFKTKDKKEIYQSMVNTFKNVFNEEINQATVEDVFVGFSRKGSLELGKYGAFAISECIRKGIEYEIISAISARSKFKIDVLAFGKGKTKKAIALWVKETFNCEFNDDNINDAIVLALCSICEGFDFEPTTKRKKK